MKDVVLIRVESYFICVSLRYEMSFELNLILACEGFHAKSKYLL